MRNKLLLLYVHPYIKGWNNLWFWSRTYAGIVNKLTMVAMGNIWCVEIKGLIISCP